MNKEVKEMAEVITKLGGINKMNTRVLEQGSKEYIFVVGMFAMLVDDFNCSPREIMALCKKVMCDNFPSFMKIYNENKEEDND